MGSTLRRLAMISMHTSPLDQPGTGDAGEFAFAFIDTGGVRLILEAASSERGASVLYLKVDDIRAGRADLEANGVVFDDEPHYHYVHNSTETKNHVVIFDTVAHGDMLPWAFECLRSRLPEMLTEAEGAHLVDRLDLSLLGPAIDAAADLANEARANMRAVKQLSQ